MEPPARGCTPTPELADLTICCGTFLGMGRTLAVVGVRCRAGGADPGLSSRPSVQSAGQASSVSPAANSSTIAWATSSWYCTGGDFMK